MWKVALLSEGARVSLYHEKHDPTPPALTTFMKDFPGLGIYLGAARYEIAPDFYDQAHYYNPVLFKYHLSSVGKSSYGQVLRAYSEKTGRLLHTDYIFNVVVDLKTKRPSAIPPAFIDQFTELVVKPKDVALDPVQPVVKPDETAVTMLTVDTSHMDYYYHTNQANYLKFCHDAASKVVFNRKLKFHWHDFALEKIKTIEAIYKGETKPGDELVIHSWKSGDLELCLQIEKLNAPVFQCRVELYPSESKQ